ncbi:MAG: hypothetical protein KC492_34855 [Myxococcales bacterium]|nr:hypothetical protein [Myxococcales bacterium]
MSKALDTFGQFVMSNLRDKAFETADLTLSGHYKAPSLLRLQSELAGLDERTQDIARRLVRWTVDSAIHDFLFALQEQSDADGWPRVVVEDTDVGTLSDGLHGEPFTVDGWQATFSRYGEGSDEA